MAVINVAVFELVFVAAIVHFKMTASLCAYSSIGNLLICLAAVASKNAKQIQMRKSTVTITCRLSD
jgi:hypothetical protein